MDILSQIKFIERTKLEDSRGWFLKVVNGLEDDLPSYTGEVYLTCARPGEAKGGHYHTLANEWFTLITGACKLKLVDVNTGERLSINLAADHPQTIFIPNHIAHVFINNGTSDFILLAYSDQLFVPEDTIMYNDF